ncbi:prolactin receptor [Discoglossus pictus]
MQKKLIISASSFPFILLLLLHIRTSNAQSPPGKPEWIICRSREKETFYCKWKPGSDGGLQTTQRLMYRKDGGHQTLYECPDYTTAGPNSCFFDKAHTSIWVMYFIYINTTNAMGSTVSDVMTVDPADIVEPYAPVNVTLSIYANKSTVVVKWLPPPMVDVKTGWLTLKYEVRVKEEKGHTWESYMVDRKTKLDLINLHPGETYVVQVRCMPDHRGYWSQWSTESYIQIPDGVKKTEVTMWVSIGVILSIICFTIIWTMSLKRCSLMSCILPPVPGPKIMGFDTKLLESGKSEDLFRALDCQGFPPTSDCEELLVEFLEVDDSKEHLMSNQERNDQNKNVKVCPADTDNDSGRGSCDSPFTFSEGCKEVRAPPSSVEAVDNVVQDHTARKSHWPPQNTMLDGSFSNFSDNKSYVWPDGSTCGNQTPKSAYHNITDVCKLATGVNFSLFLMPSEEKNQPRYFKTIETIEEEKNNKEIDLEDLHSKGIDQDTMHLLPNDKAPFMSPRTMDYVEVHKVNQNNALALIPKHKENSVRTDQYSVVVPNKEYTKVERVEGNNVLVLMQDMVIQAKTEGQSKDYCQTLQESQAEKHMGMFTPAGNEGKMQMGGMGYMDPSSFLPSFS